LNVDLDIYSRSKLDPLAAAFGQKAAVLYVGRERHLCSAHFELNWQPKTADAAIRGLAALVRGLPRTKRRLWDAAISRAFNIGIQAAGAKPYEAKLAPGTLEVVTSLKARIVVTVYAPETGASVAGRSLPRKKKAQTALRKPKMTEPPSEYN